MAATIDNADTKKTTFLFLCERLSEFITTAYKKKPFDGAKVVVAPNDKYLVIIITLDNTKYTSTSSRDDVAQMKAKLQVNTFFNGSTITSDKIIRTDESDATANVSTSKSIQESSMGFIDGGIELLSSFETPNNKTTYIFYKTLSKAQ